jgi:hypothetical protein
MNRFLYLGMTFATIALVLYSLFFWRNRKTALIKAREGFIQIAGLFFDITATLLMIIGSKNIPLTIHGMIGYSALLAMVVETIIVVNLVRVNKEKSAPIGRYGYIAYFWWIIAYVAGGLIAMFAVGAGG